MTDHKGYQDVESGKPSKQLRGEDEQQSLVYGTFGESGKTQFDGKGGLENPDAKHVYIRVVFMKLGDIDTVKETFQADVFIQARWREPKLDGHDPSKPVKFDEYWNPKLIVDNVIGEPKENASLSLVHDAVSRQAYIVERRRVKATFVETMELFNFPFDTQDLTVTLTSERCAEEVLLDEDPQQMSGINTDSFVDVQEWRLYDEVQILKGMVSRFFELDSTDHRLHASFSCRTNASRRTGFYVTSVILILFFIIALTFCTFSVDLSKRENRLQLTFILLLTTVTFKFAVNSSLPRISYLTTMDVYIMSCSVMLILVCVWHAVVYSIYQTYGADTAVRADIGVLVTFAILYFVGHLIFAVIVGRRANRNKKQYEALEQTHKTKLQIEKQREASAYGSK